MIDEEMENNLQEYKRRDAIKNEYCKKKGIVLLRLNDINTIENELTQYFIK